jgi:pimeloyl-ACP methyl ester carboxylesterase
LRFAGARDSGPGGDRRTETIPADATRYRGLDGPDTRLAALPHGVTRYQLLGPAAGAPVLLIPGMTYPMEVWSPLSARLADAGYRVLRYDLYGRGGSGHDGTPLRLGVLVEQILALREQAGIDAPAHAVSLSNADLLLNELVRSAQGAVRSVVWVAPSGFDRRTMSRRARWLGRIPPARWLWQRAARRACSDRMRGHLACQPPDLPAEIWAVYERSIASVTDGPSFPSALVSHIAHLPTDAEVLACLDAVARSGLPLRMLRFGAERDATDEGVESFKARLGDVDEVWIREGSHMGLLERPAEVSEHVLRFLAGV